MITNEPRKGLTERSMRLSRIPERYWQAAISDFPSDYEGIQPAQRYCENVVDNLVRGVGLLLWGKPGHGKTHMAVGVLKRALIYRATALFLEASAIQDVTIQREELDLVQRPISKLAEEVDILLLDDMGAEHANDFSRVLVEKLVRHRGMRNKSTIITTNVKLIEFGSIYGAGFSSAIKEYVYPVKVNGKDWRAERADVLKQRFEG